MTAQLISLPFLATALALLVFHSQAITDFDFFYFVLQWPGAYCDTSSKCCYPTTGKPAADFGIHGLWPNYYDGTYPSDCDPGNPFDASQISDLRKTLEREWPTLACPSGNGLKFWEHEWEKHGTCAEDLFDQHQYFETTVGFKRQANLLKVLADAGGFLAGAQRAAASLHPRRRSRTPLTPPGGFSVFHVARRPRRGSQTRDFVSRAQPPCPSPEESLSCAARRVPPPPSAPVPDGGAEEPRSDLKCSLTAAAGRDNKATPATVGGGGSQAYPRLKKGWGSTPPVDC